MKNLQRQIDETFEILDSVTNNKYILNAFTDLISASRPYMTDPIQREILMRAEIAIEKERKCAKHL